MRTLIRCVATAAVLVLLVMGIAGCRPGAPGESGSTRALGDRGGLTDGPITLTDMQSESRLALVIGNGSYSGAPLKNPANDAMAMAEALRGLGFEVTVETNLDYQGMRRAIQQFGNTLQARGGVGLFYFAGHGMQAGGQNYLIPIGATIDGEADIQVEGVPVESVLAKMDNARNRLNVVILDACRNNPFQRSFRSAGSRGLASISAPTGTLVAYATAPGSVAADGEGDNGAYTAALLDHLSTEGLVVEEVFKRVRVDVARVTAGRQTPWESSSLTGQFFFRPGTFACRKGTELRGGSCVPIVSLTCPGGTRFEEEVGCVALVATKAPERVRLEVPSDKVAPSKAPSGMVEVSPGRFTMGSPDGEAGRDADEVEHEVRITRGFWLGRTEVTQGEWSDLMKTTPSYFSSCGRDCPVEGVSWYDAVSYANAKSKSEGLPVCYELEGCDGKAAGAGLECKDAKFVGVACRGYRLPTEAEWEYAARAGTRGAVYEGVWSIKGQLNAPVLDGLAWYGGNSGVAYKGGFDCSGWPETQRAALTCGPHSVGGKRANAWGLRDMLGNVWEWTSDWSAPYPTGSSSDPVGPSTGSYRVSRGGGWSYYARGVRAADRRARAPGRRHDGLGFRLARSFP